MHRLVRWRRPLHGLGVDFGSSGVKAVALSTDGSEMTLLGVGREALPAGAVQDGAVRDTDAVGAALGRLLARLGVRCRVAALAIGGSSVLIKRFPAPAEPVGSRQGAGGFRDAVAREAARHVPFHLESLDFDYEGPFPSSPEPAPGRPTGSGPGAIVFGAAPREMVQNHCRAAAAAGRQVTRIELEPYALYAAAGLTASLAAPDREPVALAIAEIGASRAAVHVFGNSPTPGIATPETGRAANPGPADAPPDLLASVPAAGAGALMQHRPPSGGASRYAPVGAGEYEEGDSRETRADDAELFANRIVTTVGEALREAEPRRRVRLLVSGGGANSPGIRAPLGKLEVEDPLVLDPLDKLGHRAGGPAFAVAAGLAYQAILDLAGPRFGGRP